MIDTETVRQQRLQLMAFDINQECDGCGVVIASGTRHLVGIESCCGGGCCRRLCLDCVRYAFGLIEQDPR